MFKSISSESIWSILVAVSEQWGSAIPTVVVIEPIILIPKFRKILRLIQLIQWYSVYNYLNKVKEFNYYNLAKV